MDDIFAPQSTITVTGWMLQSVSKTKTLQRAQALTDKGNEHASKTWGEQNAETANFTLGGTYESGNMTLPQLGSTHITDFTVTYSETDFPKLDVNKNDAAVSAKSFSLPINLPVRALGVPSAITGIYTAIGSKAVKQLTIAVAAVHAEETDGEGEYGTYGEFRDVSVKVTFTGVSGKPSPTMATGWDNVSDAQGNSNTALPTGSVVYEKHFPFDNSDTNAANRTTSGGGSGSGQST